MHRNGALGRKNFNQKASSSFSFRPQVKIIKFNLKCRTKILFPKSFKLSHDIQGDGDKLTILRDALNYDCHNRNG